LSRRAASLAKDNGKASASEAAPLAMLCYRGGPHGKFLCKLFTDVKQSKWLNLDISIVLY